MPASQTEVMLKVIEALEEIGSKYLIGGSYASSAHGIARATMEIDILADLKQLERRTLAVVARDPERSAYVASAEDIILSKLRWYRQTNEKSERQWSDVLGVMSVQSGKLELEYLKHWASELGVSDLLDRALAESRDEQG